MKKRSYAIARTITFILSLLAAYALWTFLRPHFVAPKETIINNQEEERETESIQETTALEDTPSTVINQETITEEPEQKVEAKTKELVKPLKTQTAPEQKPKVSSKTLLDKTSQPPIKTEISISPPSATKATKQTLTVHNGIEKKMLGYKKFGTHYPTSFKITVDNKPLELGSSIHTTIQNNKITVRYDFEFMNGYRKGAKEVTFTLKPAIDSINLIFNWKGEYRLYAEDDKIISVVEKEVPYQA